VNELEANGQHSQKILMQENTSIVSQVNEIVFEDGTPRNDPISEPDHQKGYLFNTWNARQGAVGGRGVGIRSGRGGEDAIQVVLRGQEEVLANNLIGASRKGDLVQQVEVALELAKLGREIMGGIECSAVGGPQRPVD